MGEPTPEALATARALDVSSRCYSHNEPLKHPTCIRCCETITIAYTIDAAYLDARAETRLKEAIRYADQWEATAALVEAAERVVKTAAFADAERRSSKQHSFVKTDDVQALRTALALFSDDLVHSHSEVNT